MAVSFAVLLVSLLAIVVAQSMLAQEQVRLTGLRSQIAGAEVQHASQQLKVAELEAPAHIAGAARQQHLTAPSQVVQVPSVSLSVPLPPPKFAPSTPTTATTAAGG